MIITEYDQLPKNIQDIVENYSHQLKYKSHIDINLEDEYMCVYSQLGRYYLDSFNENEINKKIEMVFENPDYYTINLIFNSKTGEKFKIVVKEVELEKV